MATYKTPDVYVKEISIFPPSVAEVETAVPCFIGYTKQAKKITDGDLHMKAQKIDSRVEFEQYYGAGPSLDNLTVTLDDNFQPDAVSMENKFYLYDCLQLFFNNGGGKCYIISIGTYSNQGTSKNISHFEDALAKLKKIDEPTMIVAPDAVLLSGTGLYNFQQQALMQCGNLMDRVTICDLKNTGDLDTDVQNFRDNIGINNLKYGMAYTPWIKAALPRSVSYADISLETSGGAAINLTSLTTDSDIKQLIADLEAAIAVTEDVTTDIIETVAGAGKTLKDDFDAQVSSYNAAFDAISSAANGRAAVKPMFGHIQKVAEVLITYAAGTSDTVNMKLSTDIDNIITTNKLKENFLTLMNHDDIFGTGSDHLFDSTTVADAGAWNLAVDNTSDDWTEVNDAYAAAADNKEKATIAYREVKGTFDIYNAAINAILAASADYVSTFEDTLAETFPTYKSILLKVNENLAEIPPSGAVAGVYAYVDNTRGVHKAPANVSLSGVSGTTEEISFDDQKDLNVDVNAGKSINAIRNFSGKGTLVWGARTLAGNSNEWRYVNVRRFYNMVEESVKKSTYWAVFEPNDANLWVRVKAMIENYLILKWKDGALAGATPGDAFFVKCGLGTTMTPQDILEGRLNVEIGMAVVRPAEFIILKFSHKLQES